MWKKWWFSTNESGVGGSLVVVPMASCGVGGDLGRRERMWLLMDRVSGKIYCGDYLLSAFGFIKCGPPFFAYDVWMSFECSKLSSTG